MQDYVLDDIYVVLQLYVGKKKNNVGNPSKKRAFLSRYRS